MLSSKWHSKHGTPVVFLHGLLGSQQDWQPVLTLLQKFPQIRPLTLDLPYHGRSERLSCTDFVELRHQLHTTFDTLIGSKPFYLVGYSLGGRVALDYSLNIENPNLIGTILEGANIGLTSKTDRQTRWENDCNWANRFRTEPIENVLDDWYQQPVFADLTITERENYIAQRKHNQGGRIAEMLEATSLAKQPNYIQQLKNSSQNIVFFIGENDQKFKKIATQYQLPTEIIPNAGHNTHQANPTDFVKSLLNQFL